MTNAERMRAMQMRLDGKDWQYIAAELGYSKTTVKDDLTACISFTPRQVNCVYPALKRVIIDDYGGSVYAFAQACGISPNALYSILPGHRKPGRKVINEHFDHDTICYQNLLM